MNLKVFNFPKTLHNDIVDKEQKVPHVDEPPKGRAVQIRRRDKSESENKNDRKTEREFLKPAESE